MAYRALLFSKSPDTNAAIAEACKGADVRTEICTDIFGAIEKAKTQPFSCIIAYWGDQPESSFLLKRARESAINRETLAIVIVDRDPTSAEVSDNRLESFIHFPISAQEVQSVLVSAAEKMRPLSAAEMAELAARSQAAGSESAPPGSGADAQESELAASSSDDEADDGADREPPSTRWRFVNFTAVCAILVIAALAFCLWRSRASVLYLAQTHEGRMQVLREAVQAFFDKDQRNLAASPVVRDTQQDAYFNRNSSGASAPSGDVAVVATESTLQDSGMPLPRAADMPLPTPVFVKQEEPAAPVRQRAAIPDSMRNSPPISAPVVVTVNAAQMMPVSVPQPAPLVADQVKEPVALTESAARSMLIHSVDPEYPQEAAEQKAHGAVVLQVLIGRDGSVQDVKFVRGYFSLGKAAIAAVKQWRFQPYTLSGHAASALTQITVNF
jgi:periplasmic protein TonB